VLREIVTINSDNCDVLTSKEIKEVSSEDMNDLRNVIKDMLETCDHLGALGLAAPQIGVDKKVFVLADGTVAINPKIKAASGKIKSYGEGCLSVPGKRYDVKRARRVVVSCLNERFEKVILKPKGKIKNIAIQHEMDHLNGKLVRDVGKERDGS
jgi:peptide deformylase